MKNKEIDTQFLKKYLGNHKLIDIIDKMINNHCVWVIKNEYFEHTPYNKRVFLSKNNIGQEFLDRYRKIDVPRVCQKMPNRLGSKKTLLQHSKDVLEKSQDILESLGNIYLALDTVVYNTYWEKDSFLQDFRAIYYMGAFMHDIGKALCGITNVDLDRHALIGASYLYCYLPEITSALYTTDRATSIYKKLENIIEDHMLYILDPKYKEDFIDRYSKKQKHLETYLISLADWYVNTNDIPTEDKEFENESIQIVLDDLKSGFKHNAFRPVMHNKYLCLSVNNLKLIVF